MNLWDRIERWRSFPVGQMLPGWQRDKVEGYREAAAELEADLRELKAVVGRVDHETCDDMNCALSVGPHTTCGHPCPDCARCALEARIGRSK